MNPDFTPDEYVMSPSGLRTVTEDLEVEELERELQRERLERHEPRLIRAPFLDGPWDD